MSTRTRPRRTRQLTAIAPRLEPTHEAIAQCARAIWEAAGQPEGRALEHWLLAEARLRQGSQAAAKGLKRVSARPFSRNGSLRSQPDSMVL